jgi:pyruvate formate lyase activating enzyme
LIRSFLGTSLIDYPGRISSVVFFGGCNLSCPFCQNPELVLPDMLEEQYAMPPDEMIRLLSQRRGFTEGVCLTGGEPLMYEGILPLIIRIREETGLPVKLDTNGTFPETLSEVLPLVDYVALDVKSSPARYAEATGGHSGFGPVLESIRMLQERNGFELRTTMVPGIVSADDLEAALAVTGRVKRYVLQRFRGEKTLSPEFTGIPPYPVEYLEETAARIQPRVDEVIIRV